MQCQWNQGEDSPRFGAYGSEVELIYGFDSEGEARDGETQTPLELLGPQALKPDRRDFYDADIFGSRIPVNLDQAIEVSPSRESELLKIGLIHRGRSSRSRFFVRREPNTFRRAVDVKWGQTATKSGCG